MLDRMPGPRPGDNLWHSGRFSPNTDMLCNIELIGGKKDVARIQWYSDSYGGGHYVWANGTSMYELYEVRQWRYIPEPPKAPTPPPPRYEIHPAPIGTVWASIIIAAGLLIMVMLMLERQ